MNFCTYPKSFILLEKCDSLCTESVCIITGGRGGGSGGGSVEAGEEAEKELGVELGQEAKEEKKQRGRRGSSGGGRVRT